MPTFTFTAVDATPTGDDGTSAGTLRVTPMRLVKDGFVRTGKEFSVPLVGGAADVALDVTAPGEAYKIVEQVAGGNGGGYWVVVKDGDTTWADLEVVSQPGTSLPTQIWEANLVGLRSRVDVVEGIAEASGAAVEVLADDVAGKADASTVAALASSVGGLPSKSYVDSAVAAVPGATDAAVAAIIPQAATKAALDASYAPFSADPLATDSTRLARWKSAIANRAAAGPKLVMVADSWGEGYGVDWSARYLTKLQDMLRARYPSGAVGGAGYIPSKYVNAMTGAPAAFAVTGTTSYGINAALGLRYYLMSASSTATLTFTGTGVDLHYGTNSGSFGSFSYTVDGGASTVVNTPQSANYTSFATAVRGLAAGAHTIVITTNASGRYCLEGAFVYNGDEILGVKVYEAAHGGHSARNFAASPDWAKPLSVIQPHAIGFAFGTNDWGSAGTTTVRSTSAELVTYLGTLVAQARALVTVPPSIFFCIQAKPAYAGTAPAEAWEAFSAAIRTAARNDGKIAVFDSGPMLGDISTAGTDTYGYRFDAVHMNPKGHQAYADGLLSVLTTYP